MTQWEPREGAIIVYENIIDNDRRTKTSLRRLSPWASCLGWQPGIRDYPISEAYRMLRFRQAV
jgi:hypothetical protein